MSMLSPFTFSPLIQGVQVMPLTHDGKEIRVRYCGKLKEGDVSQIWMHAGMGDVGDWLDTKDYLMEKTNEGWEHTVDVTDSQFNFCFRDSSHQWDNNNGSNWVYRIT